MALIVETGEGLEDADSYVSLADANTYATNRGLTFPVSGSAEIIAAAEGALRRATTWIDGTYRVQFPGQRRYGRDQALEWPRLDAYDSFIPSTLLPEDELPRELVQATIEAAVRELANPGSLNPDVVAGKVQKSVKVGDVAVEYFQGSNGVYDMRPTMTIISGILSPILMVSSYSSGGLTAVSVRG